MDEKSELQMTGMHVQSYGERGVDWELSAPYGEMYTRKNFMRVKNMQVTLYKSAQKSSTVSAGEGYMSTESEDPKNMQKIAPSTSPARLGPGDMFVNKDVVVISTDGSKLSTDWAYYNKKKDVITSTAPVRIDRPDSITKGVGLEASSDLTRVKIFNQTLIIPSQDGSVQ